MRTRRPSWVYIGTGESGGAGFFAWEANAGLRAVGTRWPARWRRWRGRRGVVVARGDVGDACLREERPRGRPGGLGGLPRVHLAADAPWTRSTGGVRAGGCETEREMEIGTSL